MSTERELTYGEKAVGLTFNPSGNETVHKLKSLYAEIIDACDYGRRNSPRLQDGSNERARLWSVAITQAQDAQMWAVKAATWQD